MYFPFDDMINHTIMGTPIEELEETAERLKQSIQADYKQRRCEEILKKIKDMPPEEVKEIVKKALDIAGIPYEEENGKIIFDGLFEKENQ